VTRKGSVEVALACPCEPITGTQPSDVSFPVQ